MDCAWGRKNADLSDAFQIRGYPTTVFCDPDGKPVEELASHEPARVAAQMRLFAAKYGGVKDAAVEEAADVPNFPELSGEAFEVARRAAKPLAVYFYDDSPASASVHQAFADGIVKGILPKFVIAKSSLKRGSGQSEMFAVTRAPTILILNPSLEKPEEKPLARIAGSRNARELRRDLEAALLPGAQAAPPAAAAPETRSPPKPTLTKEDEALSDDEVDRQFIQASLGLARDWLKRGNKAKAIPILEDILKSYPKHVATAEARKLLEDARK